MSLLLGVLVSLLLVVPASAVEADPVYDLSEPVVFSAPALASAGDGFPFYGSSWVDVYKRQTLFRPCTTRSRLLLQAV